MYLFCLIKALKGKNGNRVMNRNLRIISPEAKIQSDLKFDKYLSISSDRNTHMGAGYYFSFPLSFQERTRGYYKGILPLCF